ncbi:MAG: Gfo/Idh/MocA family oxidoreductase [Thermoguttaceae bacterium]
MRERIERRSFLKQLGAGAAVAAVAPATAARAYAANETVRVACIGTGGRWRRLMMQRAELKGASIVGVCDIWDEHLKLARETVGAEAFATKRWQEVLDRKDVDAVMIATPDHWHAAMTIAACQAGKDVYVEKPLTHHIEEGPRVIDAVRQSKRVVQVGTQQRSIEHIVKARELVRAGHIGRVHKVRMVWNRNYAKLALPQPVVDPQTVDWKAFLGSAPDRPFDAFRFRSWRWFWDYAGGLFTDLMVHWLDVACWFLDLPMPQTVVAIGDHFMYAGKWETPDTVQAALRFPESQVQATFEATVVNSRFDGSMELMGTEATMYLDRGRYEIYPERRSKVPASELVVGTGTRGSSDYREINAQLRHLQNWIDCMKTRQAPAAPVEEAAKVADMAHLANRALREAKVVSKSKAS